MRTTYMAKPTDIVQKWHVIDAKGQTLGRLATEAAALLRGKHKPQFTPHMDAGDYVIVINAECIQLTGKKMQDKNYYRHSGYTGGLKVTPAWQMLQNKPTKMVELAIQGMLPKNRLGNQIKMKLKVYAGSEHPHQAQKPEVYELRG